MRLPTLTLLAAWPFVGFATESGVDADFYLFRDRSHDARLPWDIIDGGMKQAFFRSEFEKGLREEWTLPPKRARENEQLIPTLP